jgi:hypothetical protein
MNPARGILVDTPMNHGGKIWCHAWHKDCDLDRLHAFAAALRLRRHWFQARHDFPHYDLCGSKIQAALDLGATRANLAEWILDRRRRLAS